MQDHTKLTVWHRSRALAVQIHEVAREFPPKAAPGLRTQLMRAVMSISANIAEGATKSSRREFARFVEIAAGSASETEHHLTIALDLGVIGDPVAARLVSRTIEVRRMLFGLRRALLSREVREPDGADSFPGRLLSDS